MGIKNGKRETGCAKESGGSRLAGVFRRTAARRKIVKAARPTNLYNVSRFLSPRTSLTTLKILCLFLFLSPLPLPPPVTEPPGACLVCTRPLRHVEFQNGNERFYIRAKDRRRRRDESVSYGRRDDGEAPSRFIDACITAD